LDFRSEESVVGSVKTIVVEVAVFSCRNKNKYIEGPRVLAQTITYDPRENTTEDITYYTDGFVHSKFVTTRDERGKKSVVHRYKPGGSLRDRWLITYHDDGSRAEGYEYSPEALLLQKHLASDEHSATEFEEETYETGESFQREFDAHGNWIREIRFDRVIKGDKPFDEPAMVTYRTITYM
jgi:hypothetical protein